MKITIPTSWSSVTVKQFIELGKVPELKFDEMDTQFRILSILTGQEDDYFINIPIPDLKKIIASTSFLNTKPKNKLPLVLNLNGSRFRVRYEANKLIAGEYIDLQNYIKQGVNNNLAKIIAIYFEPINWFGFKKKSCYKKSKEGLMVQTLESKKITEQLILDHLTMDKVFGMTDFFLKVWVELMKATQVYLAKAGEKTTKKLNRMMEREGLRKSMDGI